MLSYDTMRTRPGHRWYILLVYVCHTLAFIISLTASPMVFCRVRCCCAFAFFFFLYSNPVPGQTPAFVHQKRRIWRSSWTPLVWENTFRSTSRIWNNSKRLFFLEVFTCGWRTLIIFLVFHLKNIRDLSERVNEWEWGAAFFFFALLLSVRTECRVFVVTCVCVVVLHCVTYGKHASHFLGFFFTMVLLLTHSSSSRWRFRVVTAARKIKKISPLLSLAANNKKIPLEFSTRGENGVRSGLGLFFSR